MNQCVYCGKNYPDDVTICPLDNNTVRENGRKERSEKQLRFNHREHLASRPSSVKFAVGVLVIAEILDLALLVFRHESNGARTRNFYSLVVFTFGIVAVFLYQVFRGKNWARWVVVCSIVAGICIGPFMRIGPPRWDTYFFTLIDIIAAVALFQRSSNEWYKAPKRISPAPAS